MTALTSPSYECGTYDDAMQLIQNPLDLTDKATEYVKQYPAQAHESAFNILAVSVLHSDEIAIEIKDLAIALLNAVAETI